MMRFCFLNSLALLSLIFGSSAMAQGTAVQDKQAVLESPVKAISSDAGIVIRFKQPKQTIRKVIGFVNQVDRQAGGYAAIGSGGIGAMISNPTQLGVDKTRDWWMTVYFRGKQEPTIAFAIPAEDVETLKESTTGNMTFVVYNNWVIYSPDAETAKRFERQINRGKTDIQSAMSKETLTSFERGDVSVYVNLKQITTQYAAEIKEAKERLDEELKNNLELNTGDPNIDPEALQRLIQQGMQLFLQGIDDAQGLTIALGFQEKNFLIEEFLQLDEDSKTSKLLQDHQTSNLAFLNQLPPDQLAYIGAHGNFQKLMELGGSALGIFGGENKKLQKKMKKGAELSKEIKFKGQFTAMNLDTESKDGALRTITVTQATPVEKLKNLSREMSTLTNDYNFGGVKQKVDLKIDAEEYGTEKADVMRLTQDFEAIPDPLGIRKQFMEIFYGGEGMVTRMIYLNDRVIQLVGGSREYVQQSLDFIKKADSPSNVISQARMQLSPKANVIVLADFGQAVLSGMKLAAKAKRNEIPLTTEDLKDLEVENSYLGFSLALEKDSVRARSSIPALQVKGWVTLGKFFYELSKRQQGFDPDI